jgi:restriction endonuclease S subunit
MQAGTFQRALVENSTGTTATGIRRARLERIMIPIPNIHTQQVVARSAFAMQDEIDYERAAVAKLKQARQGLMNDLLTGRVGVGAS